ncbi:MAG: TetR family transcriptional regulator [Phenylobacterium sp.]|uniref:TetR/AcrR family transcriptional regulator n=1 Tax=Phenylobacterium sp. TaxID=1871053 RepID=UPI0025F24013|nr:TetR/AcrR family transcriptional regulator [Phenylobacterium sp.]MBI1200626.1 TetR family transcriptional regulator [Phenylobacterium sp.]
MDEPGQEPARQRRRGQQLESELLDAAWDELAETGFANLTMDAVAARARTGIAVLYRRWPNKDELVFAAIEHRRKSRPVPLPDTGALRTDLLAALTGMGQARSDFSAIAWGAAHSGLLASTGMTPAEMRERFLGDEALSRIQTIYQRAHDRGEIDLASIPPAVLAMPFDLVRHDLLMERKALKPARIRTIIEDLFLPLVRLHAEGSR